MRSGAFGRTAAALLVITLAGCGGIRAAPEPPMANLNAYLLELQQPYAPAAVVACLQTELTQQKSCRDKIVQALMVAIDLRYEEFELAFFDANRYADFGATLVTIGLGTAGAFVPGSTSQILSAAVAGIGGMREAFTKKVLAEQTSVALLTAMRAQRDTVGLRIRLGLRLDATEYPLGAALADISAYYRAGTIVGALTGVTEAVGVERQKAEQNLRLTVVGRGLSNTELAVRMRNYLSAPGLSESEKDRRAAAFLTAARAVGVPNPTVAALVRDTRPGAEELLARIARQMNLPE
jgi:hypothetical protein